MSSPVKKAAKTKGGTSFRRDARLHKDGARRPDNSRSSSSSIASASTSNSKPSSSLSTQQGVSSSTARPAALSTASARAASANMTKNAPIDIDGDSVLTISSGDSACQILEDRDPISDSLYTAEVRERMKKLLDKKQHDSNPTTFSQLFMKKNLAVPLITNRGYLLTKAGLLEKKVGNCGGVYVGVIHGCIPKGVGGRDKQNMKENIKKTEMIIFLIEAWGVVRKLLSHPKISFSSVVQRKLESYVMAMQGAEDEAIGEIEHQTNENLNKQSMKIPPDEKHNGYLEGGSTLPPKKHQICACCNQRTTQYPANQEHVKAQRKAIIQEWRDDAKQYKQSQNDDSVMAPINKKTGKPWTKPPPNPPLPPLFIVCKANHMSHTHGVWGYKCPNCNNRTCETCKNYCTFVCSTE